MKLFFVISLSFFFLIGCNADRNKLTVQDLQNNGVDTSALGSPNSNNNSNNNNNNNNDSTSGALGSQKVSVTVIIDPSFPKTVTRVRVRAFTSRTPIVVSVWEDLQAGSTTGTFTGIYTSAPNPTTKFGIHAQAFNGSTLVGEFAGSETEYANNGDGSTIVGNVITIKQAL